MNLKTFLKRRCPAFLLRPLRAVIARYQFRANRGKDVQEVFRTIYGTNHWNSAESVSGPGSELRSTRGISDALPRIISEHGISSMLDIPCGDFHWMQHVALGNCAYIGADIVPELIQKNTAHYASPERRFLHLDATRDALPKCDLIFCRDCFIHLPFALIFKALENFKASPARYLLTTTYLDWRVNFDIPVGGHRGINLRAEPFNFPEPLALIHESDEVVPARKGKARKCMGLWSLRQI